MKKRAHKWRILEFLISLKLTVYQCSLGLIKDMICDVNERQRNFISFSLSGRSLLLLIMYI